MAEKVAIMVLKVDLQCSRCYKKIKKLLSNFTQIREQVYDEKQNMVTITVICCSPEKIRDKLCCKGGKTIKSIEIKKPQQPEPVEKLPGPKPDPPKNPEPAKPPAPKEVPKADPPKNPEPAKPPTPNPEPTTLPAPKADPPKIPEPSKPTAPKETPKDDPPKKSEPAPKAPEPEPGKMPEPVNGYPYPVGVCCGPCYEGYIGGPCYNGYGRPIQPPSQAQPCSDGPSYDADRGFYVSRCDYFSEENALGCIIM